MLNTRNNIMLAETGRMMKKKTARRVLWGFLLVYFVMSLVISVAGAVPTVVSMYTMPFYKEVVLERLAEGDFSDFSITPDSPDLDILYMQFLTIFEALAAIFAVRVLDKRSYVSMGLRRGCFGSYLIGYVIGALLITGAEAVSLLTGNMTIKLSQPLDFQGAFIVLAFLAYLIQGMAEEAFCRGYLMMSLIHAYDGKKNSVALGVGISSLVFAILHLGNPGITVLAFVNLFLAGVLFALYVLRTDNLWGAAALHSAWNFFQGHILGSEVSGISKLPSVFESTQTGSALINGGSFGLEGGIGVTIVELLAIALILFLPKRSAENAEADAAE